MSCQSCGSITKTCGCTDTAYTTPIQNNCDTNCIPGCAEYTNAKCVILTDGVNDIGIQPGDTLESIVQRLVLAITNPECIGLPSANGLQLQVNGVNNLDQTLLNLVEGTGVTILDNGNGSVTISCSAPAYTVTNGLTEAPANNFKLGGYLTENTTIDGSGTYILNLDNLDEFNIQNAGLIDVKSSTDYKQTAVNHSFYNTAGSRILNVENTLGQMTLDGYYASTGVLYTTTPAYVLGVDNFGNVLKAPFNAEITGSISGDNGITANTSTNVRLGGPLVQDTQITGGSGVGSPFDLSIGDFGSINPIGVLTLYASTLNLVTPNVATGTAVLGTVLKLTNALNGTVEFGQPFTLTTSGTTGAATFTGGTLNIPNYAVSPNVYTADNGLAIDPLDQFNIELGYSSLNVGSDLTTDRYINTALKTINLSGVKVAATSPAYTLPTSPAVLRIENTASPAITQRSIAVLGTVTGAFSYGIYGSATGSSGIGVYGVNTAGASGVGVFGTGTQAGVWGTSTIGYGVRADNNSATTAASFATNSSTAAEAYSYDAAKTNSTIGAVANLIRLDVSGAGAIGAGGQGSSIDYRCTTATAGQARYQTKLKSVWIDASTSSYSARFSVAVSNNGTAPADKFSVRGDGVVVLEDYGNGSFPGVVYDYLLGVDTSGEIVEVAKPIAGPSDIIVGKIVGNGGAATLSIIHNTSGATITLAYSTVGNYALNASSSIFTTGQTVVFFQCGANPIIITPFLTTTSLIGILTYDNTLTPSDNVTGTMFKIEIYN